MSLRLSRLQKTVIVITLVANDAGIE